MGRWKTCKTGLFAFLRFIRLSDLGYTADHCRYALQMSVAISLSLVFVVVNPLWKALDDNAFWIAVTTAFVLEPNVGSALFKGAQGLVGATIGAGLGIASQATAQGIVGNYNFNTDSVALAIAATACIAVATFFLMLHRLRYPKYAHTWHIAIYTLAIVSIPGIHATAADYVGMVKLLAATAIGVFIACFVSFTVFPTRALGDLKRLMASALERMANLSFEVMGELCQEGDDLMRFKGSTGTDSKRRFVDDGLEDRFEPLHALSVELAADLNTMDTLVRYARMEQFLYIRKPKISVMAFRRSLRAASRLLTALASLLHTFESGIMRLDMCLRYHDLLEDVRQDLASALTALSGMIWAGSSADSAEYAEKKLRDLVDCIAQLQQGLEGATVDAYDADLESLAVVCRATVSITRQVVLLYCELNKKGAERVHDLVGPLLREHLGARDAEKGRAGLQPATFGMRPPPSAFAADPGPDDRSNGGGSGDAGGTGASERRRDSCQPRSRVDLTTLSTSLESKCRWLTRQSTTSMPGNPLDPGEAPDLASLRCTSGNSLTGSGRRRGNPGLGRPELSTLTSGDESHGDESHRESQAEQAVLESDASFRTARGDSVSLAGAPSGRLSERDEAEAAGDALPGHQRQTSGQEFDRPPEAHGNFGDEDAGPVIIVDPQTASVARAMLPVHHDAHRRPLNSLSSYHASDNPFE
ncbi:hypothetical protein WJX73_010417 [Symbiochloris irregularis]|uniref:Uncharacterized protein n=1 Tax=Symbiochloris irregularis TaxID=706552 RepID=A0AAW1NXT4_9CHLO